MLRELDEQVYTLDKNDETEKHQAIVISEGNSEDDNSGPNLAKIKTVVKELDSEDPSTDMYSIYCVNLRASKQGTSHFLNYQKLSPEDDLQAIHLKN